MRRLVGAAALGVLLALGPALPASASASQLPVVVTPFEVTSPGHLQLRATGQVRDPDRDAGPLDLNFFVHDDEGTQLFPIVTDADGSFDVTVTVRKGGPVTVNIWVIDQLADGSVHRQENGTPWAWDVVSMLPVSVEVDRAAPRTTITSWPASPVLVEPGTTRAVPFTFTADEAGSTFTCSLDAAGSPTRDWQPCRSGDGVAVGVGEWEFRVRAQDPAGNLGAEAVHAFSVAPGSPTDPGTGLPVGGQVSVQAAAVKKKSKLRVRVRPGSAEVDFRFVVQKQVTKKRKGKKAKKVWKQVRKSVTRKAGEQRVLNLPKGRYRVVVPAQHGMAKARSKAVRLRR